MKTSERHHLKENDLALVLARAQVWFGTNAKALAIAAIAVVLLIAGVAGYVAWQASIENDARARLAAAMVTYESRVMPPAPSSTPDQPTMTGQMPGTFPSDRARLEAALPQFLETADAFPGTNAARTARFHAAGVLVSLGRHDEAIAHYDQLMSGRDLMARTARLGKAEAHVQAGQYDEAIAVYTSLVGTPDAQLPAEGLLMELARVYQLAGRLDDARTTLTTIVEQHAESPFAPAARAALDQITVS
ncbi:MAG: tetratricopeptide repeat protein [Vicinamibacterales bacterium]|nr:tetratricopeptide repeat protein [Vicinamibacterales bacterium]